MAPHSAHARCAAEVAITASYGWQQPATATTLAALPLTTDSTWMSSPKWRANAASARRVCSSSP